ncbi:MAG: mannonate dehydratase, partial [Candidatus Bathyarchaeia archaeon]
LMKVSVTAPADITEDYLRWLSAIGVDYVDLGLFESLPGAREQGYPDLDRLLKMRRRLREFGLDINRVTLPSVGKFMLGEPGGEREVENAEKTLKILGEARIPIARPAFAPSSISWPEAHAEPQWDGLAKRHRGGYTMRRVDIRLMMKQFKERPDAAPEGFPSMLSLSDEFWLRFKEYYKRIVEVAEDYDVKIAMHPSDAPLPDTPFNGLGLHRIIDFFPSKNVGLIYCVGTRYEAGGTQLVLDEINYFGRKGKIFLVHFRNVRGSLATAGSFEEVLLDDGDMNMFQILLALHKVGYNGCLNPDHVPYWDGDTPDHRQAWSYSVGYIKALLAALAALP